ncbi:hypothetical protein [Blastococcus mobilis]|uniref:Uncharacterized protein n=1 Tax=Blastococcus mobilis TaxID=1938746 RepID=A0A239AK84_9ACTN|nr:hypothetical protein [Blastococcus mobilis]SNR95464.1 hypothetical protein SAMN06272737_14614 [Blastococcus mobilis]
MTTEEGPWPPADRWIPMKGTGMGEMLLVPVPEDAFSRVLPDAARGGFPAMIVEAFWITEPVFHLLRVDGFTLDDAATDGVDERSVLGHERISLEQVLRYKYDLGGELGGTVELVDGRHLEVPVMLIDSYRHGGPQGYGRSGR